MEQGTRDVERAEVLHIPLHAISSTGVPEVVEALLQTDGPKQIMIVRWWDFMRARSDRELRKCARTASLVVPVSRSLVGGARFLHKKEITRHQPFDLVIRILGALEDRTKTIYLLGGNATTLRTVEQNLRETFPGLRCVGRYTGLFTQDVENDIITAIRKAEPDLLLLGTGVPGRDKWILRHQGNLGTCIAVSCPEAFSIFAERRKRIPRSTFERGLDFVPDLVRRPWRLLRLPVFLWYLLRLLIARTFRR